MDKLCICDVFETFDKITKKHPNKNRQNVKTSMWQDIAGWQPVFKIPKDIRTAKWQKRQDESLSKGSRKERRTVRWLEIRQKKLQKKVEKLNDDAGYQIYFTNGISIYMDY